MHEQDNYPMPPGSLPPHLQDPSDDWDASPTASPFVDSLAISAGLWAIAGGILYWVFFY